MCYEEVKSLTLKWFDGFDRNMLWNQYRFKTIKQGYPPFDFPKHLIDEVDIEQFLLEEKFRIPLFIGTQFGVNPDPKNIYLDMKEPILVARLGKSLLSGCVAGLSISCYKEGVFHEIEFFKN